MMKRTILRSVTVIAFGLGLVACSVAEEPRLERKFGTPFGGGQEDQVLNLHAATSGASACERLTELSLDGATADEVSIFSYASEFSYEDFGEGPEEIEVVSNVAEQPMIQALLGSSKVQGIISASDDDFYDMAKVTIRVKACNAADAASWAANDGCAFEWNEALREYGCGLPKGATVPQCQALWQAYTAKRGIGACAYVAEGGTPETEQCIEATQFFGILNQFKDQNMLYMAKNLFLSGRFRGIFGAGGAGFRDSISATKSIQYNILNRVSDYAVVGVTRMSDILTAKLPLFPQGREWSDFKEDAFRTLSSIKNSAYAEDPQERMCAVVLAHRAFAQILGLNGYVAPKLVDGSMPMLDGTNTIEANFVLGTYLRQDRSAGSFNPTVVTLDDLKGYDPRNGLILSSAKMPSTTLDPANALPADLSKRLDRMAGLEYLYEATSPAAGWSSGNAYLLGDIEDENGKAVLPPQFHSLALGHVVLGFKNIAALNLRQIKADGSVLAPGDTAPAAGIVLMDSISQTLEGEMTAENVMKFSKIVLRLDAALENVLSVPAARLELINTSYSGAALPGLQELSAKVNALKLPLRFLLDEMLDNEKGCFSKVKITIAPGVNSAQRIQPLGACGAGLRADFEDLKKEFSSSLMPSKK